MLRRKQAAPEPPPVPGFGEWLLLQFSGGEPTAGQAFASVERMCANACSLLIGAAHAAPDRFAPIEEPAVLDEARLIARRTADGFKASLADRQNTVIAWPWDHIATSTAWAAARAGDTSERALGESMAGVAVAYASRNREQLRAVLDLWTQITGNLHPDRLAPDLEQMGTRMFEGYRAAHAPALSSPAG